MWTVLPPLAGVLPELLELLELLLLPHAATATAAPASRLQTTTLRTKTHLALSPLDVIRGFSGS